VLFSSDFYYKPFTYGALVNNNPRRLAKTLDIIPQFPGPPVIDRPPLITFHFLPELDQK
jgi:hypothetical protein